MNSSLPENKQDRYEKNGEFFILTEEEAMSRYREKVELLTALLIRMKDVTVTISTSLEGKMTEFLITHAPTHASVCAAVIKEEPDGKRRYTKMALEAFDYLYGIKPCLRQAVMNAQGRRQLFDPDYKWVDYSINSEI
jgi:hypothetical protein